MIERLLNHRVIVYRREGNKWRFLRRFNDFPHNLQVFSFNCLYLFTPNLENFVTIDNKTNELLIK